MIKKAAIVIATVAVGVSFASSASAHQHYIETPNGKQVLIREEPPHVHENHHHIHERLHTGPAEEHRAISVNVVNPDGEGGYVDRKTGESVNPKNKK
ncbi:hypothetical protein [Thalassobacillus sp. C254]|uniref:hypothetical protein n=1 Tax=Thalassobacillus sp. C254 TaxID=1225341 RepID=UPI0006D04F7D|nr:hypothetical protein [Thalassobacillus sp. C254]